MTVLTGRQRNGRVMCTKWSGNSVFMHSIAADFAKWINYEYYCIEQTE